jgi:HNH endonuclease
MIDPTKCPLCDRRLGKGHSHHVKPRSDDGSNGPANLLRICVACHALIHDGEYEDSLPRQMAAVAFQIMQHGIE